MKTFVNGMREIELKHLVVAVVAVALVSVAGDAMAAGVNGGNAADNADDFQAIWDTLAAWSSGSLGKVAAGAMAMVGIIGGIARQSLMAFGTGIGAGVGMSFLPEIIDQVVGATISPAMMEKVGEAAVALPLF